MKRLAITVLAVAMALIVCSCSANMSAPAARSAPADTAAAPAAPAANATAEASYEAGASGSGYPAEGYDKYSEEGLSGALPLLTPGGGDTLLSYQAEMHLQTTDFMAGSRLLLNTVEELGGHSLNTYIEGRDMFAEDSLRYARYDLRVPSRELSGFLIRMEEDFNLLMLNQRSLDFTVEYGEADTRMADLKEQEARLMESLTEGRSAEDMLDIENELSRVQGWIAELEAETASIKNAVAYSYISVSLYEVREPVSLEPEPEPAWSERMGEAAKNSLNNFLDFLKGLSLFIISALPVLAAVAVIGVPVIMIARLIRRRRQSRKVLPATPEESEQKE
ncbi:MAG: DUF4349 domain-containing protein [Oscillospiraceae bacterium]|jgi:hypothetical protein|nr:DUF4349 domain-containing protein [Oscillospiraceae bacterium]